MPGETATVIAMAMRYFETQRSIRSAIEAGQERAKNLHLFDSFMGYPEFDTEVDRTSFCHKIGRFYPGGYGLNELPRKDFIAGATKGPKKLLDAERVHVHAGYFSETLGDFDPATKLALVHVDCDLYQSSIECLDNIFAHRRMTQGSVLILSGLACNRSSNKFGMRRAWREVVDKYGVDAEDCGELSWGVRKYIIHTDAD